MGIPQPQDSFTFYWNVNVSDFYAFTCGSSFGSYSPTPGFRSTTASVRAGTGWHSQYFQIGTLGSVHRKDGTDLTATSTGWYNNTTAVTPPPNWPGLTAANWADNSEKQNGRLAFLACWLGTAMPSTADLQRLEGWTHWQYGLQSLLPAGHPYKSAAPTVAIP